MSVAVTDSDTGANAQLQYAIDSINGESCTDDCVSLCLVKFVLFIHKFYTLQQMFSIRLSSGVVILERSLDFETARQHTISILVQVRLQHIYN